MATIGWLEQILETNSKYSREASDCCLSASEEGRDVMLYFNLALTVIKRKFLFVVK